MRFSLFAVVAYGIVLANGVAIPSTRYAYFFFFFFPR